MHPSLPILSAAASGAGAGALFSRTTDNVADRSEKYGDINALLPEGSVFAIWGPIYLGLFGLGIAQALPDFRTQLAPARPWLALTPPIHFAWYATVRSGQSFLSAMLVQTMMFGAAIKLHQSLAPLNRPDATLPERTLRAGAGLYMGWLGAANLPGWSLAALESGWSGQNPTPSEWGTAGVVVGAVAGAAASKAADNPWVEAAFVNALAGIAIKQWKQERPVVAAAAGVCAAIGGARVLRGLWRKHKARRDAQQHVVRG